MTQKKRQSKFTLSHLIFAKLLYNLAPAFTESAGSVSFVCVDVHSSGELRTYTNYNIAENKASVSGCNLYGNDLLVLNAGSSSFFGSEVDVTLSCDNAFTDFNFAAGANELTWS